MWVLASQWGPGGARYTPAAGDFPQPCDVELSFNGEPELEDEFSVFVFPDACCPLERIHQPVTLASTSG